MAIPSDLDRADELLREIECDGQATMTEVRRLVNALRPPALDELGLAGALRQVASSLSSPRLRMVLDLPDQLPPLSAELEAATLRIAQEALANVQRHADAVLRAIVAVAHGEVLLGADVADRLAALLDGSGGSVSPAAFPDLTDRERETLRLIGRGFRNAQIAAQMHITQKTVRNYVTRIFAKLTVSSRVEAVIRARDAGLS